MVGVQSKEVSGPFHGDGLTEEVLLAPVLMVLKDDVTNFGFDERTF